MTELTLLSVRDWHRNRARNSRESEMAAQHSDFCDREAKKHDNMADAIDFHLSQPQPVAQGHVSDDCDGDTVLSFANETGIYSIVKHDEGHQLVHTEAGTLKLISKPFSLVEAVDSRKLAVDRYTSGEEQRAFVDGYAAATPTTPTGHRIAPPVVDIFSANGCHQVRISRDNMMFNAGGAVDEYEEAEIFAECVRLVIGLPDSEELAAPDAGGV